MIATFLSISLIFSVFTGCSKNNEFEVNTKPGHLSILDITFVPNGMGSEGQNEELTRSKYIDLFQSQNPNVEITFDHVQTTNQRILSVIDSQNPDIILLDPDQMSLLIAENHVMDLDSFIQNDDFDLDGIAPYVKEGIKEIGQGKLFGLAPYFRSQVLLYNKNLFDETGIAYPKDGMTWDETFQLAQRLSFKKDNHQVFGISLGKSSVFDNMLYSYTTSLGLRMMDLDSGKMTVQSQEWEQAWKTMIDLERNMVMPGPDSLYFQDRVTGPYDFDDFLSGRAAMEIVDQEIIVELMNRNKKSSGDLNKINWDIVSLPDHPSNPGSSNDLNVAGLMSINSKSGNNELAWSFIKFINGDQWAKIKTGSKEYLLSRTAFNKPLEQLNYNINAFFTKTPVNPGYNLDRLQQENTGYIDLLNLGRTKFELAASGQIDTKRAIAEWQTQGNVILNKINSNTPEKNTNAGLLRSF